MKPSILIYGNCQGQALEFVLRDTAEISDVYDVIYLRSFDTASEAAPPGDESDWKRCVLLFDQVSSWSKPFGLEQLPTTAERIPYPAIDMALLWPLQDSAGHYGNVPEPGYDYGRNPYGDRIINDIIREGLAGDEAWAAYQSRSADELANFDRRAEIEKRRWRQLDTLAGSTIHEQLIENLSDRRPAFTYNHPTSWTLRAVFAEAFGRSSVLSDLKFDGDKALNEQLSHEPYLNFQVPIHPIVAESLGLRWWSPEMLYQRHMTGGAWPYEAAIRRQIASE